MGNTQFDFLKIYHIKLFLALTKDLVQVINCYTVNQ